MDVKLVMHVPGASGYHRDESLGFPIHYIAGPSRLRAATFFYFDRRRIAKFVRRLDPDIIHAHGTEDSFVIAAQAVGRPYVVTAQGMFSQINHVMPPRLASRARVVEFVERRSLARAKHIIAKSDYVADWIRLTYPHLAIHRIPNTFDPRIMEVPLDGQRQPSSLAFVGNIDPRKGLHLLAEALKNQPLATRHSPLVTLHIFGNRGSGASDYEKSTINSLRSIIGDRLALHGVVPAADLPRHVAACELLVAPSIEEMFGNQVIEALLVGTWPVVSSGTAMEENVRKIGAGTLFKNGNASDLARGILDAQDKIKAWNREETRLRVDQWLGPSKVASLHLSLYCKILDEG